MSLICPACRKVRLAPQTDPNTKLEIDVCPKCSGMWFDANELSTFFQSSTLKRRFFLTEETAPLQSVGYTISTRARACPRCKLAMVERLFGDVSIDICNGCRGIWLDDGELLRIVRQYEKGERGETNISRELSQGIHGRVERPSLGEVIKVIMAFFGKE